ncbi:MAG: hypothetical protein JST19_18350 [Bacteroidetes bacterium]|nr:hypothetical protein [Bacteroidota bacterium]
MKFPNWFKIVWWILLLIFTGIITFYRLAAIVKGQAVAIDIFIFLIFVALMLVPIFSEIEFFGIKLKMEIEKLKKDITVQLGDIRNDIRNTQNQTVQNFFHGFGPPPPDNKLPELENEIDELVTQKPVRIRQDEQQPIIKDVPDGNLKLFKIRFNIETELRRIWQDRFIDKSIDKNLPLYKVIQDLTRYDIVNTNLSGILKEILAICNYAIHGEKVTDNQIAFVTKHAQQVLEYLADIM